MGHLYGLFHDPTSHWLHGNSIPKIGCHYFGPGILVLPKDTPPYWLPTQTPRPSLSLSLSLSLFKEMDGVVSFWGVDIVEFVVLCSAMAVILNIPPKSKYGLWTCCTNPPTHPPTLLCSSSSSALHHHEKGTNLLGQISWCI